MTNNPDGFTFYKSLTGSPPVLWTGTVGNSQTIKKGDAVIASSGYIAIATDTSTQILGVANEDVTTTSGGTEDIEFYPAFSGYVFSGQTATSAQADVYSSFAIDASTPGAMFIDDADTNPTVVNIVGVSDEVVAGTKNSLGQYGRLAFVWLRSSFTGVAEAS